MNIQIKTIAHKSQRYNTAGDYYKKGKILNFFISKMGNKDYEFMVMVHEVIEQYLCERKGITNKMIDDFDMSEYGRTLDDPGSDCKAPYHVEHMFCLRIEKLLCAKLGIDWDKYNNFLNEME